MLKYSLIFALIVFAAQIALGDDHTADTANDGTTEQAPHRKDVYQKLGITSGSSGSDREPAQEQPQQQQREETQPQQNKEENTNPPPSTPDTSEQPLH